MNIQSISDTETMTAMEASRPHLAETGTVLGEGEREGLPWWTYFNPELLEIEKEQLFRRCWQVVGHVSDIPEPGDYLALDVVGERALVMRGKDGQVRCFHNVCRHRGSRVVKDGQGHCRGAIVCPFHGWTYDLDGRLRGMPKRKSFPELDPDKHGLVPLESEIWMGFIFVRFLPSRQPSMAALMAEHAPEIANYRLEQMKPLTGFNTEVLPVNWKAVRDVDNEGYHVPVAHPTLQDLYGQRYHDETHRAGVSRSLGTLNEGPGRFWSVRHYRKILPKVEHLPEANQRAWLYIGLFPNTVLSFYPDQIGFYQEFPLGVDRTVQRAAYYALPDASREMKLARYLTKRIDRVTGREDTQLIVWSWESMQSSGFAGFILSDLEAGVRSYHDQLRRLIPVFGQPDEPAAGSVDQINTALASGRNDEAWVRD
ncbi:MAG TPA: aromatic ring-hydroxylating dioxygenase subunit alpha [Candidatus Udaeobacter sp.]|nr:aromatic ring-hydroxylating dioxygenase subunit alpha [Candidatus Udaeobacter sp.]